jgi:membrane-bound lytic murein transglycosylase A
MHHHQAAKRPGTGARDGSAWRAGSAAKPPFTANVPTKSRWAAVDWGELPGVPQDSLNEAWNAWIKNCERPSTVFANLCGEVRR